MKFKTITVLLGLLATLAFAATASATHNTIGNKKGKLKLNLVKAYPKCSASNSSHKPPLPPFPMCTTAAPNSGLSAFTFGPSAKASAELKVVTTNTKDYNGDTLADSPTTQDVRITVKFKSLLDATATPYSGTCCSGSANIRITDNQAANGEHGTMIDIPFPVLDPAGTECTNGTCKVVGSADAGLLGDVVGTGEQSNIQIGVAQSSIEGSSGDNNGPVFITAPDGEKLAEMGLLVP